MKIQLLIQDTNLHLAGDEYWSKGLEMGPWMNLLHLSPVDNNKEWFQHDYHNKSQKKIIVMTKNIRAVNKSQ